MSAITNSFIKQALELSPPDRLKLVDQLLESLHKPNPDIDAIWAKETDARVEAYNRGEIESVSAEEVLKKYTKQ